MLSDIGWTEGSPLVVVVSAQLAAGCLRLLKELMSTAPISSSSGGDGAAQEQRSVNGESLANSSGSGFPASDGAR